MQLQNYFAQDKSGNALPGATVYVLLAGTATMATGLQDKNGAAKTNPFLSDSQGLIQFAVANGDYDIRVVKGPHDYKLTSVRFEDSKKFREDLAILSIESFGVTGTADDASVIQAAVNYCATNNILLRAKRDSYVIGSGITIPNNFRCDLGNAWILRKTGTTVTYDMWANVDQVNGNTGLDIRNVRFDGQRTADSLTSANPAHRFCGLRLVKCSGQIHNIRADNTVNGEIQVEGTRGGIMLDRSVDMKASLLFADGTMGSGVFTYQGKNFIVGVDTKNNTGSGFTSFGCDDNDFHHISSDGSGFSGVSVNGERMRCSFLSSKNSPLNFAGVNIGHDAVGNRANNSIIDNVTAESALGWGIFVGGSTDVIGSNWISQGAAVNNLRAVNSPGLRVNYFGKDCAQTDAFISGTGRHFLTADIQGSALNSLATGGSGTIVEMGELSKITGGGSGGGTTGAVNAANTTTVLVRGEIIDNLTFGVISNGASALADIRGATVSNNTSGNFLSASSGVLRHQKVRTGADAMSGSVTATNGSTTTVVNNTNAQSVQRVVVWAGNAAAVAKGVAFVNTVTPGVSFTFTLPTAAAGTELYQWEIL